MKTLNSKRLYHISGFDCGIASNWALTLEDILNEEIPLELYYSLQDNIDAILELKINEALTMHSNRDSKTDSNLIIVLRKR